MTTSAAPERAMRSRAGTVLTMCALMVLSAIPRADFSQASETSDSGGSGSGTLAKIDTWTRAEKKLMRKINRARERHGLDPLSRRKTISFISRRQSRKMRDAETIFHSDLGSMLGDFSWRIAGENVGMGPDIGDLHRAFMRSPGHRHNVLDRRFNRLGVGVRWKDGLAYVTVQFLG